MIDTVIQKRLFWTIRVILIMIPVFVLGWLLDKYFVFNGLLTIHYQAGQESKLVTNFASKEEYKLIGTSNKAKDGIVFQQITKDPIYFNVNVPRSFSKAKVSFLYQNPNNQPVVKLGLRQSTGEYYFKTVGVFNKLLDDLDSKWQVAQSARESLESESLINQESGLAGETAVEQWNRVTEGDLVLWKKNDERYHSIEEFLNSFLNTNRTLEFNYDLEQYSRLANYQRSSGILEIKQSLRDSQEIYTYLKDEELNLEFQYQDINRYDGPDEIKITILHGKKSVYSKIIADDGIKSSAGEISEKKTVKVEIPNLPEGIYRIQLSVNPDIIFRNIKTSQHLFVFANRLYLAGNSSFFPSENDFSASDFYTDGSYLKIRTDHLSGIQTVQASSDSLKIDELHVDYTVSNLIGLNRVYSPLNDLDIRSDGYFAFSRDSYFDPRQLEVSELQNNSDISEIDYIIADYPKPIMEGGWYKAEATFEGSLVYLNKDKQLEFVINLPGISDSNGVFRINELNITLEKEPITLRNIIPRIYNFIKKI